MHAACRPRWRSGECQDTLEGRAGPWRGYNEVFSDGAEGQKGEIGFFPCLKIFFQPPPATRNRGGWAIAAPRPADKIMTAASCWRDFLGSEAPPLEREPKAGGARRRAPSTPRTGRPRGN